MYRWFSALNDWRKKLNAKGATAVEYALITGVFIVAVAGAVTLLDDNARAGFANMIQGDDPSEVTETGNDLPLAVTNAQAYFNDGELVFTFDAALRASTHVVSCTAQSDNSLLGFDITDTDPPPPSGVYSPITLTGANNLETYDCQIFGWNDNGLGQGFNIDNIQFQPQLSAPQNLTGTPGDTQATLVWQAPASDGGFPITDYTLKAIPPLPNGDYTSDQGIGNSTSIVISGLLNDVTYTFEVRAVNQETQGPAASVSVTPVAPATAPDSPVLTVTPNNTVANLSWTTPDDNNSPITDYLISYKLSADSTWSSDISEAGNTYSLALSPGTYDFRVAARNGIGTSLPDVVSNVSLIGPPSAPLNPSAIAGGTPGVVDVSWQTPNDDNGSAITGYETQASTDVGFGTVAQTQTSATTAVSFSGLSNGTQYYFRVRAENAAGFGAWSSSDTATPSGPPGTPNLTATAGDAVLNLTWTTPTTGGSPITNYQYEYDTSNTFSNPSSLNSTNNSEQVTGVTNGTELFARVRAQNVNGFGPWSSIQSATPFTAPDAPALSVTADSESLNASWTLGNDGGNSVTNYEYQYDTDSNFGSPTTASTSSTSVNISPLTASTQYYVRVRAENAAGFGAWSNTANATPYNVPGAIGTINLTAGNQLIDVDWAEPTNNGNSISGYEVQVSVDSGFTNPTTTVIPTNVTTHREQPLTASVTYYFRVRAENAAGFGAWSPVVSGAPFGPPDAPVLTVTDAASGFDASWTIPADNGQPITGYEIKWDITSNYSVGTPTLATTQTTAQITGLTPGTTYYVSVAAQNSAGFGPLSNQEITVPYTVPGQPQNVDAVATGDSGEINVTWSPPLSDGGRPVTSYDVERDTTTSFNSANLTLQSLISSSGSCTANMPMGALNEGVAGLEGATGIGYIMWSQEDVFSRFSPDPYSGNADHFVSVQFTGGQWYVDNNASLVAFTPVASDCLIAEVDYDNDTVTSFKGTSSTIQGINSGYSDGNLTITPNVLDGRVNPNEYGLSIFEGLTSASGCPAVMPIGALESGIAAVDSNSGIGYIMWSQESVHTRFNPFSTNSDHFVAVKYDGQWKVDNNSGLSNFTPVATDCLVAEVDFSSNVLTSLEGTSSTVQGINAGYDSGNLVIVPEEFGGNPNAGEFWLYEAGDLVSSACSATMDVLDLNSGVAATESATGTGYIMWSQQSVHSRFSTDSENADHFVAVKYDGQWKVDNNSNVSNFTPVATDCLIAEVDFTANTATMLEGTNTTIQGIDAGYDSGDLVVIPEAYNGNSNAGEFWLYETSSLSSLGTPLVIQDTGLDNGVTYYYRVRAANIAGAGAWSSVDAEAPVGPPDTPTVTASGDFRTVTANWTAPNNNGAAISQFTIEIADSDQFTNVLYNGTTSGSTLTYTEDPVTAPATYWVRVKATNSSGDSAWSTPVSASAYDVPDAPANVTLTAGAEEFTADWAVPPSDGGSAVTGYEVQYDTSGSFSSPTTVSTTALTETVTGLNAPETYWVRVRAENLGGFSNWTAPASVDTFSTPDGPDSFTATPTASGTVETAWNWTQDGGSPIISYDVQVASDAAFTSVISTQNVAASPYSFTGLANGTTYYFRIRAENAGGFGSWSAGISAVPAAVPDAVTSSTVATNGGFDVNWTAPNDNGSSITGYTIQWSTTSDFSSGNNNQSVGAVTSTNISASAGTTYYVRVLATNAIGNGPYGNSTTVSPFGPPDAPSPFTATPGTNQVSLTWGVPNDNGAAITSYEYQYATNSSFTGATTVPLGTGTSTIFSTSTANAGTTYYFRIRAINSAGNGAWSATKTGIPYNIPATNTINVDAQPVAGHLIITWNVPNNNGSSITGYNMQWDTDPAFGSPANYNYSGSTTYIDHDHAQGIRVYYRVRSLNAAGYSAWSNIDSDIAYDVPFAPNPSVSAGDRRFTVSWSAPSNNGAAIDYYQVQYKLSSSSTWTNYCTSCGGTNYTVTGLHDNSTYHVRVRAHNARGWGGFGATDSVAVWGSTIYQGEYLYPNQQIRSSNNYRFVNQGDGNLVIYNPSNGVHHVPHYSSSAEHVVVSTVGRVNKGFGPSWVSNTTPPAACKTGTEYLVMQTDGNLVLYSSGVGAIWSTNTGRIC